MKRCPKCGHDQESAAAAICAACGLVFAKWVNRTLGVERAAADEADAEDAAAGFCARAFARLTAVDERTDPILFWGRVAVYVLFVVWGLYFVSLDLRTNDVGASFMHRVNLVFHEAGHVLFRPFGQFMTVLGGSLMQLLVPAVVIGAMVWKNRDNFGGALGLWWFGQSMKDLAPYINDARDLQLQLLTGHAQDVPETHDWANILLDLGLIFQEKRIARIDDFLGSALMLLALAWAGYVLLLQYRNLAR
mgnify:FL=1